nr:hypothetical protein CFP56_05085 [Quercus suber]
MATPLGSWDQDGENEISLPRKHVSKSLPKARHTDVLQPSKLYSQEISKKSQRCRSRILWQNTATLQQGSAAAEFCGRIQQRYSKKVLQQNSEVEYSNVTAGQYRSRILWQNTATLQQDSAVAEFCTAMLKQSIKYPKNSTIEGLYNTWSYPVNATCSPCHAYFFQKCRMSFCGNFMAESTGPSADCSRQNILQQNILQ